MTASASAAVMIFVMCCSVYHGSSSRIPEQLDRHPAVPRSPIRAGSPEMEPAVKRCSDGSLDVIVRTVEGRMGQRAAGG